MGFLAMAEPLIVFVSLVVFFILDLVDRLLCVVFRALDAILDSDSTSCYCKYRIGGALPYTHGLTLGKDAHEVGDSALHASADADTDTDIDADGSSHAKHVHEFEDSPSQIEHNDGRPSSYRQCLSCLPMESQDTLLLHAAEYAALATPLFHAAESVALQDRPSHVEYLYGMRDSPAQSKHSQDDIPSHSFCTSDHDCCPLDAKYVHHGQPEYAKQGGSTCSDTIHGGSRHCLLNAKDDHLNGIHPSHAMHVPGREGHPSLAEDGNYCRERLSPICIRGGNKGSPIPGNSSEFLRAMISRWSDCGCSTCTLWQSDGKELLFVHTEGKGHENVVFIHGFLSSSALWSGRVIPHLSSESKASHRLFAVDLLGFGKSPKPRSCLYTMADQINKIEESILQRYKIDTFHLVAHSMGCIVALALAAAHPNSVKTITLIAPPYFQAPANESGASYVLRQLAPRRIWPPLAFGASLMSWYEHVGRGVCFLLCKQHFLWEWVLSILTLNRISRSAVCDFMQHTHHSAWHIFHNVICGEAHALDGYLNILEKANCKIHVIHGTNDSVVPAQCSYQLQKHFRKVDLQVLDGANHFTVIFGREKSLALELQKIWEERKH